MYKYTIIILKTNQNTIKSNHVYCEKNKEIILHISLLFLLALLGSTKVIFCYRENRTLIQASQS